MTCALPEEFKHLIFTVENLNLKGQIGSSTEFRMSIYRMLSFLQLCLMPSIIFLQNHTNTLMELLDRGISLQPIIASIDEFTAAANESLEEAKV